MFVYVTFFFFFHPCVEKCVMAIKPKEGIPAHLLIHGPAQLQGEHAPL